jgi:hypothetical protein
MKLTYLAAAVAPIALATAMTTSIKAQQAGPDACSYVSDAQAGAALNVPVQHAALSNQTCAYRATKDPNRLSFVTIISRKVNGSTPSALFASWLQQAKGHAQPITGVSHAYTIGSSVIALRSGSLVLTGVSGIGESPDALRKVSERLAISILQQLK